MAEDKKRTIEKVDLDKDFVLSAARVTELQKGRNYSEIPITDEFWKALHKHRAAHGSKP